MFATAVGTMKQIVEGMHESAPALTKAAHSLAKASESLSSETNSLNDGLERQLGEKSALVVSLNSVGELAAIGRVAASESRTISSTMEQRLTSTYSAILQSGEKLIKAAERVPDLIESSYKKGSAELQTAADKLVDEKLDQFETALKADYEKLSHDIARVRQIAEEIPPSTRKAVLQSGEALKETVENIPDLIKSSYAQGFAQLGEQLERVAHYLSDEKLGQLEKALEAESGKLSDDIATIRKIAEMRLQLGSTPR